MQRVEGPHHRIQAHVAGAAPLFELEQATDAGALMRGVHARQLGVQDQAVLEAAKEAERESDQLLIGVEGAQDEPADLLRASHNGDREHVAILGDAPGAPLELLAGAELVRAMYVANGNRRRRRIRDAVGHRREDNAYDG